MSGYGHKWYVESLSEFGVPQHLQKSDGWILARQIPGTTLQDAMGCYPIFSCRDWSLLQEDLDIVGDELVSLTIVSDPFGEYDQKSLKACFPDLVIPFKQHHIVELSHHPDLFVHPHHQKNAKRALLAVSVDCLPPSDSLLVEWIGLYDHLIIRHNIEGISAFSPKSFTDQFRVPGLIIFRAAYEDNCIGMILWYVQGDVAYYHLGAYSPDGYDLKASFALFWKSIEYFRETGVRWLSLGAGAGMQQKEDGLTRFKSGWATGTRIAYLCGRIFNQAAYNELSGRYAHIQGRAFFPVYRNGGTV